MSVPSAVLEVGTLIPSEQDLHLLQEALTSWIHQCMFQTHLTEMMHVAPAQFLCAIPPKPTGLHTELNKVVYVRSAKPTPVYNTIVMSGLLSGFVYSYVSCSMRQVPRILN